MKREPTVLLVSNTGDSTADFVQEGLEERGVDLFRFNTEEFPVHTALTWGLGERPYFGIESADCRVSFDGVRSVYFRRPGPIALDTNLTDLAARKFAAEESGWALAGAWLALDALWVNHPARVRLAEHKLWQLSLATRLGFDVPRTLVTNSRQALEDFRKVVGDLVMKPVKQPFIMDGSQIGIIYTTPIAPRDEPVLGDVQYSPCIFQQRLEKLYEIRATVVGDEVLAARIDSQASAISSEDWRRYDFDNTPYTAYELPAAIQRNCVRLVRDLGLCFGAIDLVRTPEGRYVFLEINPNGQWGWIEDLTQLPIRARICDLLIRGQE